MEKVALLAITDSTVSYTHLEEGHLDCNEMAAAEAYANPKIEFVWNTTLQEILGDEEVCGLILKNVVSGETREVRADGIFFFVGMVPQTAFVQNVVACDAKGYICLLYTSNQSHDVFPYQH